MIEITEEDWETAINEMMQEDTNMTTHKELAEFILALDRGEKVEYWDENGQQWWPASSTTVWRTSYQYRIVKQPEKRKAECWEDGAGEYRWLSPEAGKVENAYFKRIPALDREWTEGE